MADGTTAFEKRYGKKLDGSILFGTFGSVHERQVKSTFGEKTLKGTFLVCVLRAEEGWSGDLMIADCEDMQESRSLKHSC